MQTVLILADTDLDRFRAWMDKKALEFENEANEGQYAEPIIYGWDWLPFSYYVEFCAVTPTPKRITEQQHENSHAFTRERTAMDEYIEALYRRSGVRYDNGPRWLYLPKDAYGQLRDKLLAAYISAENFTIGQLRVTFWRDDHQPGYDVLLDALKTDFAGTWQAAAGFPGKTSAPDTADNPQSDAGDTAFGTQSDQAGEPPRPGRRQSRAHERARERLRSKEDETTVKADWCKDYEEETGMTPAQTASGEKELWRNVKRAVKIGR